ncbi:redoxin domain-containing protein [Virgibacillus dakarensis]|uniref:Thiol:disulfide interchange protein tlpA n=1 Tax=Lentibacillus populi TaxID=1827502 RepID=A0A9W5X570_9BACI|nr:MULTISPECIES: TlpA disulfide reductase family protein [Bacillaceae]MBT2215431.1 TlpA family protein disulfide reductase [Virgibacillus dakarensis]MTW87252.1 redoxin domain-containing protein [Virgibacillus dakarensis]GGB40152.1 thiol:disulfide interchange protein tlpA [Lentibacillus populi]
MKKIILIVIVVGMLGFATYDFVSSTDETTQEDTGGISGGKITSPPADNEEKVVESDKVGLAKGQIAPDFELKTLEGETVRLSDYKGKRVLANFWATWCPPCRAEIPDLEKLYNNKDVVILAVNLTESEKSVDNITDFVEEYEMTFPVLMDVNSDVSTAYQVQAYPTSYMIDSNGRIQFIALGAMNYDLMVQQLEKME